MNLDFAQLADLVKPIRERLSEINRLKDELREKLRRERQCVAFAATGERCRAWAVYGNPTKSCYQHGGAETAKIPRSERLPVCRCGAYNFPHRRRGGLCSGSEKPFGRHPAPQGQRRYGKRTRKAKMRKWLKEMGL